MTDDTAVAGTEDVSTSGDQPLLKPSLTTFPWLRAALGSVVALAVQTLAIVAAVAVTSLTITRPGWTRWEVLTQYLYVLYSAHHVPIVTTVTEGVQTGSRLNNLLYADALTPLALFFGLPIVTLLLAGVAFGYYRGPRSTVSTAEESAMIGTGFAIPYAVLGVVGSFVFVRELATGTAQATASPALLWTLVGMFLFPMVFVTIGALVGIRRSDRQAVA